jgi:hypothetical protein
MKEYGAKISIERVNAVVGLQEVRAAFNALKKEIRT